jgi:hypothetical protein
VQLIANTAIHPFNHADPDEVIEQGRSKLNRRQAVN